VLVDYVYSQPVSGGLVTWPSGRETVIAKVTVGMSPSGAFVPVSMPEPLSLDRASGAGLSYPSDFAPYKPSCDVAVVGAAALERDQPGRLAVGSMTKTVDSLASLGARETFCPDGDPTEPSALEAWSSGQIDFVRFHATPPDQRTRWPSASFALDYARGPRLFTGRFDGPFVRAHVLAADGSRVLARIPMLLDTLLLDPAASRLYLVFRGLFDRTYPRTVAERLALDLTPNGVYDPRFFAAWPVASLATPRSSRATATRASLVDAALTKSPETRLITGPISSVALPFGTKSEPTQDEHSETLMLSPAKAPTFDDATEPAGRQSAMTLPFTKPASASQPGVSAVRLTADDLQSLREGGETPIREAWEAGNETFMGIPGTRPGASPAPQPPAPESRAQVAPSPAALPAASSPPPLQPPPPALLARLAENRSEASMPFRSTTPSSPAPSPSQPGLASPSDRGWPVLGGSPPSLGGPLARPLSSSTGAPPVVTASSPGLARPPGAPAPAPAKALSNADRVQAILKEIWAGERSQADILAANGLTEVAWRALRRSSGRGT